MFIHLGHGIQLAQNMGYEGMDMLGVGFNFFTNNTESQPLAPLSTLFSFEYLTPVFFLIGNIIVLGVATFFMGKRNNFRYGEEHGSAVFATAQDYKGVKNNKSKGANIILTNEVSLSLDHRATRKNLNVIVSGGPGSGKTRFFVKPNLCQLSSSFVCTDPKGEALASSGKMLKAAGFRIKVLNLVDMLASNMYNPFVYLRKDREEDVLSLLTAIVQNTGGGDNKNKTGDPFWESGEMLFLQAIFFYILYEEEPERQNMDTVMEMLRMADFTDEVNPLDEVFARLEQKAPNHVAVTNYKLLKASARETLRSIVIMANARFAPFSIDSVSRLFRKDDFALDELDNQKTAIFIIISPSNTTFNFIAAMFYTQYFAQLDYIANWVNPRKKGLRQTLQIPVLMILDEFANVGKIPNFEKILAYARSLNIGIFVIVQSLMQLKDMYGEAWEGLWDSADTKLFLGGQSQFTLEYISKQIGKQTIDNRTKSRSFGQHRSSTQSEAILGRELMTPDEIALLPDNECLLFMKAHRVFKGTKYDIQNHKNYKQLSEDSNFYIHKVKHQYTSNTFCFKISLSDILAEVQQKQESTTEVSAIEYDSEEDLFKDLQFDDDEDFYDGEVSDSTLDPPLMPEVGGFISSNS